MNKSILKYFDSSDLDYLSGYELDESFSDLIEGGESVNPGVKEPQREPRREPQRDKMEKKIDDFKHRNYMYKSNYNEMNFIEHINKNTYPEASFDFDKTPSESGESGVKLKVKNNIVLASPSLYNFTVTDSDNWVKPIEKKNQVDILAELANWESQRHSYLTYNSTKASLVTENPNFIKGINYFIQQPISNSVSNYFNKFAKFIELTCYYKLKQKLDKFVSNSPGISVDTNGKTIRNIKLIDLPNEILQIVRHINYYFKDIKSRLVFNADTGYYSMSYEQDGQELAVSVLCKHLYMTLDKESLFNISLECARDGQCKYCGDSLANIDFDDTTRLPSSVAELAYLVLDAYGADVDTTLYLFVYTLLSSAVAKHIAVEDENFDARASAISALYVYKIIKDGEKEITKNISPHLKTISGYCADVGWDGEKIEIMLGENLFEDTAGIRRILLNGLQEIDRIKELEEIFTDYSDKKVVDIRDKGKLDEFVELLRNTKAQMNLLDYITGFSKSALNTSKIIFEATVFDTFTIFANTISDYCPVMYLHEFRNKVCIGCGITADFGNLVEVFNKYNDSFSTGYDMMPVSRLGKIEMDLPERSVEKILKVDVNVEQYMMKALDIDLKTWNKIQSLLPAIKHTLMDSVAAILRTNTDELTMKDILKLVVYIDSEKLNELLIHSIMIVIPTHDDYIKPKRRAE